MFSSRKHYFLILFLLLYAPLQTQAVPVRSVSSFTLNTYLDGDIGYIAEETFNIEVVPGFTPFVRLKLDIRPDWWNFISTLGTWYVLGNGFYAESSYGLGYTSDKQFNHTLLTNIYYEKPRLLLIGGLQGQLSPPQVTLIPSLAAQYTFFNFFALWGKYMFIYDTVTGIDNAGWVEARLRPSDIFSFRLGATLASYHAGRQNEIIRGEGGALAGFEIQVTDFLALKYEFKYTYRTEYQLISNMLLLDFHFK